MAKTYKFLDFFPNHTYRYLDQTGNKRFAIKSSKIRKDLNLAGYCSYFSVNGFSNFKESEEVKKKDCTNLNAFFFDIDEKISEERINEIKKILDPTFIIETYHGFHFYWCLDEVIYKEDMTPEEWEKIMTRWEKIEKAIIVTVNADPGVCDIPRILRVPGTYYWKESGDAYKNGVDDVFKIKGIYKETSHVYSMDKVVEAFPIKEQIVQTPQEKKMKTYADEERNDFFRKVNLAFPIRERESFKRLISGEPETLPSNLASRNLALLVVSSLMRQDNWTKEQAFEHIKKVGWHGIENERGGMQEIMNTINSAFRGGYTYSYRHEIIVHNIDANEEARLQETYMEVLKGRKEKDKIRFSNYEKELIVKYPHLRKNDVGIIYNYSNGVYKEVTDLEMSNIILRELYDDMLWGYRTGKCVSDKMKCLHSIIPYLDITDDKGYIANVKNGLLNIITRELQPHSPNFVSIIQYDVTYDPEATCPIWLQCLNDWTEGEEKKEKQLMLQQFSGYCLSSSVAYQKALFLVGDGGAGKSTFVDTIAMILGEEATASVSLENLYGQYGMKGIIGKRLNVIEEVHGNYYESDKLKKLISGEKVTIDIKYKDQFTFRPQTKFIFAVNALPRVNDTSTATERRICAVNFGNSFRDNPNTDLRAGKGILISEASGILNWMLDGATNLRDAKKFVVTKEQIMLMSEYRQENSSVEGFIGECLTFEEGEEMSARELYDNYKEYCNRDGRKFKGNIAFTKEMRAFGSRYMKFTFHERANGHDIARFEGVKISDGWGKYSNNSVNVVNYLNK